jgi:ribosomal-protein-alanine N-acetyltransferase
MDAATLVGPQVVLRPFAPADVPAVLRYASDPEVTRYLEWEAYDDPGTAAAFIRSTLAAGSTWIARAITLRDSGEVIGGVDLRVVSVHDRCAELGYGLARAFWGHGYAVEAAGLLVEFGFRQLALDRVEARCAVENTRSIRILERLGMRCEGRLARYRWKRGAPHDYRLYALTPPRSVRS